jgi:hypothetical protein
MKPQSNKTKSLFAVLFGIGLSMPCLHAANTLYAAGDLLLFFQKEGGSNTVYVNLGNAALLYRGSAAGPSAELQKLNIIDISASLSAAFGPGWATDTGVYAGLAAARSSSTSTTISAIDNGDQKRTLYASKPRQSTGTPGLADSVAWDLSWGQPYTVSSTGIIAMGAPFASGPDALQAVFDTSVSNIDNQNPFLAPGIQGTAFSGFSGGVQQVGAATPFGSYTATGQVEFALDLYRILPLDFTATTGEEVPGPRHIGTYEGTVVVGSDGKVSFLAKSAFDDWIDTFPSITASANKLPGADPDNDGLENLMEFVLNGNPSVFNTGIAPVLDASGPNFEYSFSRRDDSKAIAPLTFQYGNNLAGWTDVAVTDGVYMDDDANVSITPNGAAPDLIQISISKSAEPTGRLFGRLKTVK